MSYFRPHLTLHFCYKYNKLRLTAKLKFLLIFVTLLRKFHHCWSVKIKSDGQYYLKAEKITEICVAAFFKPCLIFTEHNSC